MAETRPNIHPIRWLTIFILIIVVASLALGSIATVNAGHRGVLLTWGKVEPVILGEGISFITPYVNQVVQISVMTNLYKAVASSASADLQIVTTEVGVNYHLESTKANAIYQKLGLDWEGRVIQPAIQEAVKASTAKYTAEELITKRAVVKEAIDIALKEKLSPYNIIVETDYITDFKFSPDFENAIEAKVTAIQLAQKAENDLARIQVEAQQAVAIAQGQANATITKAVAEAQAIRITGEALKENPQLVALESVKKWNGVMPVTFISGGQTPTILLPIAGS